jgi:hypothetical protein
MLNVGARISDAARIGRQHEAAGWLKFVAWKNRNKKSRKTIECPITRDLAAALAATPTGDMTYLANDLGRAFTINGLGNKMRDSARIRASVNTDRQAERTPFLAATWAPASLYQEPSARRSTPS